MSSFARLDSIAHFKGGGLMSASNRCQDLTDKQLMSAGGVSNINDNAPIQEADNAQSLQDEGCITWCVAHTQPLKESLARQNLLDQGYDVYMPRFKKTVRHARKVEERLMPLFPRYIFVGMDASALWRNINGTRGVSYVVMGGENTPSKVPASIIHELKSQEVSEGVVPLSSIITFSRGEKIRVIEGIFADQMAVFESMNDKSRVQVLLTFMGREMKMALPSYAVEAV
jgi:transcriptional antiterminator RfaH